MSDNFSELRKTLAEAQKILERIESPNHVQPVVGQETPLDTLIYVPGFATMSRRVLIKDIQSRMNRINESIWNSDHLGVYHQIYKSGILKTMIETEIRHQGKEL